MPLANNQPSAMTLSSETLENVNTVSEYELSNRFFLNQDVRCDPICGWLTHLDYGLGKNPKAKDSVKPYSGS